MKIKFSSSPSLLLEAQSINFQFISMAKNKRKQAKEVAAAISPKHPALNLRAGATGQARGFRNREKVVVAMSGGVDSSVAAALLKKEGYNVVGVFMSFWEESGYGENRCCSSESETRARKVAKILNIPFYVFNFEKEFKKRVVDYFLNSYKKGITPNPCVVCNKKIKFGLLLEKALKLNVDFIATGHYARIKAQNVKLKENKVSFRPFANAWELKENKVSFRPFANAWELKAQNHNLKLKTYKLLKAKDKEKDQSYFLWRLNQRQLKRVLFPIGDYARNEIEKLAKKFELPFSGVKKSQEICFIPKDAEEFLRKYLKPRPGLIVDKKGKKLGQHQGLYFYTIGQRKGIKLPAGPYFVLRKDLKKNLLIVTKNEKDLYKNELVAKNVNWIFRREPVFPVKVKVKIRYRHQPALAIITKKLKAKTYNIKFNRSQRAITPGQSAVFYLKDELLGGGIII